MTSTDLKHWYEGPRVGGFDYATDPVVAPLGLDFQDTYRKHIAETPVIRHLGRVVVFCMDDILFINRDRRFLGNGAAGPLMGGTNSYLIPLDLDGEEHTRFKRILDPLFAPKSKVSRIARLEPTIRRTANELIDQFVDKSEVEVFSEFCSKLPTLIFVDMLGLPRDDVPFFQKFKDDVVRPVGDSIEETNAVIDAATTAMGEYLEREFDRRIASGEFGDDLIGGFLEAAESGENLTRAEILSIVKLLVVAGLDTVVASLSCFLMFLARNPEHRRQLVEDPELSVAAVEELLRHQTPVQQGWRKAIQDVTLPSGEEIKAGELIQVIWASANVDDAHFTDPAHVDFTRFPNRHIAFASGFHRCLGSHLARIELRVALEEWHRRIPEYSVNENQIQMVNYGVRTMFHLPLQIGPTGP